MGFKVEIKRHAIIDEKAPFLLYAVEVHSPFSKKIVFKRYNHFSILNAQVNIFYNKTYYNS